MSTFDVMYLSFIVLGDNTWVDIHMCGRFCGGGKSKMAKDNALSAGESTTLSH
jgi:hypothetical protein